MTNISAIILTYNEELHIRRCLENVKLFADTIYIVDCFSTDNTVSIAKEFNTEVIQHSWPGNQAEQLNWAFKNINFKNEWIFRIDADEYLTEELIKELHLKTPIIPSDVNGVIFKRRHYFLGKWIKKGIYPVRIMRMIRNGKAECENKLMDEHFKILEGRTIEFENDFVDHNLNNLDWWIAKHNEYATREAIEMFNNDVQVKNKNYYSNKKTKYSRLPLYWRAFLYFIIRYIIKGGFLEGREGFLWHFFQGWWYRTLVDAKLYELKHNSEKK